ncbi:hypothetical protein IQ267_18775 [filamentous cyanobacterium LEGE 07170]|nr:hypothetical protein [filamentous cyanobacterium LEGE 07170]
MIEDAPLRGHSLETKRRVETKIMELGVQNSGRSPAAIAPLLNIQIFKIQITECHNLMASSGIFGKNSDTFLLREKK